ncbi:hypothetical protein ACWCOV_23915 [Kribbella sp. NPDC002412]
MDVPDDDWSVADSFLFDGRHQFRPVLAEVDDLLPANSWTLRSCKRPVSRQGTGL